MNVAQRALDREARFLEGLLARPDVTAREQAHLRSDLAILSDSAAELRRLAAAGVLPDPEAEERTPDQRRHG